MYHLGCIAARKVKRFVVLRTKLPRRQSPSSHQAGGKRLCVKYNTRNTWSVLVLDEVFWGQSVQHYFGCADFHWGTLDIRRPSQSVRCAAPTVTHIWLEITACVFAFLILFDSPDSPRDAANQAAGVVEGDESLSQRGLQASLPPWHGFTGVLVCAWVMFAFTTSSLTRVRYCSQVL